MDVINHDVLVIGGGLAGLRAAIAAVQQGASVALVSKVYPMRSHTVAAEGGAAAVVRTDTVNAMTGQPMTDSLALHGYDTVSGSDYIADQPVVEYFVAHAPDEIIQLEHWGCPWSRDPDGRIAVRTFGGMSTHRTVFAADKSGFHMLHAIFQTSLKYDGIVRYDENFATSLLVDDGRCQGAVCMDQRSGEFRVFTAKATILATGGVGRLWAFTTNGFINTGDGHGLAYRAGAPLSDMEFPQYHPTGLPGTGILITEAARSEGGYLINNNGDRFLSDPTYKVANRMELGPRDMISRAEIMEFEAGRGVPGRYGDNVLLDLRHLGAELIDRKLPFVRELAQRYIGIDPVKDPIPVRPVVHYMMGGVRTDIDGASRLPGLFAAGECAQEGLNGANRLGSNSLTECLVFGARTGAAAARFAAQAQLGSNAVFEAQGTDEERRIARRFGESSGDERVGAIRAELQKVMEDYVGVFRTGEGLKQGSEAIRSLKERFTKVRIEDHSKTFNLELQAALEVDVMLELAQTVVEPAILREESRGSQARRDFPNRDDEKFLAHSMAFRTPDGPRIEWDPADIIRDPKDMLFEHDLWVPKARAY